MKKYADDNEVAKEDEDHIMKTHTLRFDESFLSDKTKIEDPHFETGMEIELVRGINLGGLNTNKIGKWYLPGWPLFVRGVDDHALSFLYQENSTIGNLKGFHAEFTLDNEQDIHYTYEGQ